MFLSEQNFELIILYIAMWQGKILANRLIFKDW